MSPYRTIATCLVAYLGCGRTMGPTSPKGSVREHQASQPGSQGVDKKTIHEGLGVGCVIADGETIVVLDFEGPAEPPVRHSVTEAFRSEVQKQGLYLSPYQKSSFDVRLMENCDVKPADDGSCMASAGRRLGTGWLLWGVVSETSGGRIIDVQLVQVSTPSSSRSKRFVIDDVTVTEVGVRKAWRTIVAR